MSPKKATAGSTPVYVIISAQNTITSIHASFKSANASKPHDAKIETYNLVGGNVTVEPEESNASAPKANIAVKKTRTPSEQRAANVDKPKKGGVKDEDLPDNVRALLKGSGGALAGMAIIVTGVPSVMGRANAEKLVVLYGGKVSKSLSKNTSLVVVGSEAGPAKLQKIEELGIKTMDEDELVALIEAGAGKKRPASTDEEEEEEGEEEEAEKPKKSKKQKK